MTDTNKMLPHRDYLIISSIDWSENWQMHQQLATALVKSGNRVLFIENTGVRAPRVGDFIRISSRIRNWVRSTRGFFDIQENLTVFSPIFLPFPYSWLALIINRFLLSRSIEKLNDIRLQSLFHSCQHPWLSRWSNTSTRHWRSTIVRMTCLAVRQAQAD